MSALKDALKLEAHVTRKIRDIASVCEDPGRDGQDFNDYHVSFNLFFKNTEHNLTRYLLLNYLTDMPYQLECFSNSLEFLFSITMASLLWIVFKYR